MNRKAMVWICSVSTLAVILSPLNMRNKQTHAHAHKNVTVKRTGALKLKSVFEKYPGFVLSKSKRVVKPTAKHVEWFSYAATWYDGEEGINGTGTGITKSGRRVRPDYTIAVDPRQIPLGSIVVVRFQNGREQVYHADDVGGAIRGNRIDIYEPSREKCLENGRQKVLVRIIK